MHVRENLPNMYPRGQITGQRAGKIHMVNLLTAYRNQIHNLAIATTPLEAEDALQNAQKTINALEEYLSGKEILDMRETVSVFYWKASRRIAEGI